MLDFSNVQTRDGRKVEIVSIIARGEYPVLGYIGDDNNIRAWTITGRYTTAIPTNEDLVPIPKELEKRWQVAVIDSSNIPRIISIVFYEISKANEYVKNFDNAKVIALHDLFKE